MESQLLQMSSKGTRKDSVSTDQLIREWLFRFGLNFGKDVVPLLPLWQEQLGGIEPATLHCLFECALRTCKFFPTIAEILENIKRSDAALVDLEGEDAWQKALALAHDFGCDYSIASAKENEDPALNAGLRAAGGCRWLATCTDEQLSWAKKIFLEVYAKHRALPEMAPFCSHKDSPVLREVIEPLAQQKSFPPCERPPESQIADDNSGAEELREVWSQCRREVEVLAKEKSTPRNPAIATPQFTPAEIFKQRQMLDRHYASLSTSVPRSDLELAAIEASIAKHQMPKPPQSQQEIMDGATR